MSYMHNLFELSWDFTATWFKTNQQQYYYVTIMDHLNITEDEMGLGKTLDYNTISSLAFLTWSPCK